MTYPSWTDLDINQLCQVLHHQVNGIFPSIQQFFLLYADTLKCLLRWAMELAHWLVTCLSYIPLYLGTYEFVWKQGITNFDGICSFPH